RLGKKTILSCRQCLAFYFNVFVGCKYGCLISSGAPYFAVGNKIAPDRATLDGGTAIVDGDGGVSDFSRSSGRRTCLFLCPGNGGRQRKANCQREKSGGHCFSHDSVRLKCFSYNLSRSEFRE